MHSGPCLSGGCCYNIEWRKPLRTLRSLKFCFFCLFVCFFFNACLYVVKEVKSLSSFRPFVTPWTVACQPPLSMGFCRQENWSGLPFPSPGDLPDPGIEAGPPALQAASLPSELTGKPIHDCVYPYMYAHSCLDSFSI